MQNTCRIFPADIKNSFTILFRPFGGKYFFTVSWLKAADHPAGGQFCVAINQSANYSSAVVTMETDESLSELRFHPTNTEKKTLRSSSLD